MSSILIRTIFTFLLLILSLKLMGKRQIGELEINELVSTLLISEIAAMPITEPDIPLLNAIIPILFIMSAEILISRLKNKTRAVKKILEGNPTYLIYKGKLRQGELDYNRISLNELLREMRKQSIFNLTDVDYAVLEECGNISFYEKDTSSVMAHYLVIDGETDKKLLKMLGLNDRWLEKTLKEQKTSLEKTFLLSLDDQGTVSLIRKEEK